MFIKDSLNLDQFSKKQAGKLSGGNKKKLVCAMSLFASPNISLLEEPTTGLDPVSRKSLIKTLKNLQDNSLIISHQDEGESICDDISIMINERFFSNEHLKEEYGTGYLIEIRHANKANVVDNYVE